MKIACIGEAMIELAMDGDHAQVGFAGDTLNTAIYLKRCIGKETEVSFVTALGTDEFSRRMMAFMQSEEITMASISQMEGKLPGVYSISTDAMGERSFHYWRETSAARMLFQSAGKISFAVLDRFDVIYFSGITLAILPPNVRDGFLNYLERFRHSGRVAFDSNYRPKLWENIDAARHYISAAWNVAEICLPSADDEMALYGDQNDGAIVQRLQVSGPKFGALKRGERGPLGLSSEGSANYESPPSVVDTTAAGDSFNGAFLADFLTNGDEQEALVQGHKMALRVIAHRGAIIPKN